MSLADDPRAHFEALFAADADPWRFRQRWFEARKRALTLACLTRPRYASAYEPGCANGELSAALAERCDRLLATDGAAAAVAIARRRLAGEPHVTVACAWVPDAWPDEPFDLIVISEFAYYLAADALALLVKKALASLRPGGELLACHWRRPIDGCRVDGDALHTELAAQIALPRIASLVDPDFRLDLWSSDTRSVAQREGLVEP